MASPRALTGILVAVVSRFVRTLTRVEKQWASPGARHTFIAG